MKKSKKSSFTPFDYLLHPYTFALKEGGDFQDNFLDYSLLLLQVGHTDIIPSPRKNSKLSNPNV